MSNILGARTKTRSPAPRPQIPRGDAWNSNEWTRIASGRKSRGRNRRGNERAAKMNYGGMRRKMLRASICSRTFPRPLSGGDFRRGFVTIGMQFRKKGKKNVRRAFARPCFSAHLVTFTAAWSERLFGGDEKALRIWRFRWEKSSYQIRRSHWNDYTMTIYLRINKKVQRRNIATLSQFDYSEIIMWHFDTNIPYCYNSLIV